MAGRRRRRAQEGNGGYRIAVSPVIAEELFVQGGWERASQGRWWLRYAGLSYPQPAPEPLLPGLELPPVDLFALFPHDPIGTLEAGPRKVTPKKERPLCGARTRQGTPCQARAV